MQIRADVLLLLSRENNREQLQDAILFIDATLIVFPFIRETIIDNLKNFIQLNE